MAMFVQAEIGWVNLDHVVQIDREERKDGIRYVLWLADGKERWCRDLHPFTETSMWNFEMGRLNREQAA